MSSHPVELDRGLPSGERVEPQLFDFRRPSKFSREHMRGLEVVHEMFVRRVSSTLGHRLRTIVSIEPFSTDQITYEDYIRSMPNPSVIGTFSMDPLPGALVVEMSTELALSFVDRLLGGTGTKAPMRGPTDIEARVITDVMASSIAAIREALEPVQAVEPKLESVDFNPRFVQVVAPTEMILPSRISIDMPSRAGEPVPSMRMSPGDKSGKSCSMSHCLTIKNFSALPPR